MSRWSLRRAEARPRWSAILLSHTHTDKGAIDDALLPWLVPGPGPARPGPAAKAAAAQPAGAGGAGEPADAGAADRDRRRRLGLRPAVAALRPTPSAARRHHRLRAG